MSTAKNEQKYFIAIVPPPPVYDEALRLKNHFKENYNSKASLNSPPHITLHMPFSMKEEKEMKLFTSLSNFSSMHTPIKVCIDNFEHFPPRVIFLNVVNSVPLKHLQKALERTFKKDLNLFNANYGEQPFHPHITLAFRDLKKDQYKKAWEEFQAKEFKEEFMADKLTLLKHDGKVWQVYREFPFTSDYSTDVMKELETTEG